MKENIIEGENNMVLLDQKGNYLLDSKGIPNIGRYRIYLVYNVVIHVRKRIVLENFWRYVKVENKVELIVLIKIKVDISILLHSNNILIDKNFIKAKKIVEMSKVDWIKVV